MRALELVNPGGKHFPNGGLERGLFARMAILRFVFKE